MKTRYIVTSVIIIVAAAFGAFIVGNYYDAQLENFLISISDKNINITLPENITQETALDALIASEKDISEMKYYNLSTFLVGDMLREAKRAFVGETPSHIIADIRQRDAGPKKEYLEKIYVFSGEIPSGEIIPLNFTRTIETRQRITAKKKQAYLILDNTALLSGKEEEYRQNNFNTTRAQEFLLKANEAFAAERYDDSEDYLKQAETSLKYLTAEARRVKEISELAKNFVQRYWILILAAIAIIITLIKPTVRKIQQKLAERKVIKFKKELRELHNLLVRAQEDCFRYKRMTVDTYKKREAEFRKRTAEINEELPFYEAAAKGKEHERRKRKEKTGLKI